MHNEQVGILGQELLLQGQPATAATASTPFNLPGWAAVALALAPGAAYEGLEQLSKDRGGAGGQRTEFLTRILEQESPDFEAERGAKRARWALESKELNNGRLAMVGVLGMLAQELATGEGLF